MSSPSRFKSLPRPATSKSVLIWLAAIIVSGVLLALLPNESNRLVVHRTLGLGLSAAAIAIPLGALNAWICRGRGIAAKLLLLANVVLLLVPMFIYVSAWDAAFGKLGWLTSTRGQVLVPLVSGWAAAVWIHGIAAVPQVALILLIGLGAKRGVEEEQALLDATPMQVAVRVSCYRWLPLLILAAAWIMLSTSREIAVTDLYQIGTLAEQIYLGYSLGINSVAGTWTAGQLAEAGSISDQLTWLVVAWLALVALFVFFRVTQQIHQADSLKPGCSDSPARNLLRPLSAGGLLLLLAGVPAVNVVVRACFYVRPVDGQPVAGYSLGQLFESVISATSDYREEFVWSTLIALTSSLLIFAVASLFGTLSVGGRRSAATFCFSISLALSAAVPGPYLGTVLADGFSRIDSTLIQWLYNYTITAPVIANFIFCWPLGAIIGWFIFHQTPRDVLESSGLDGAGWWQQYWQFGIRANGLALLGCWILTFAICFGELSASHIVRPAGMDTVPRKMLGDLHAGVNELTAGITIVIAVLILLLSLLGWWLITLNRRVMRRPIG